MQDKRENEKSNTPNKMNSAKEEPESAIKDKKLESTGKGKKPESTGKRRVYTVPSRYMQKPDQSVLQKKSTPVLSTTISKGSGTKPKPSQIAVPTPKFKPGPNKIHSSTPTSESSGIQSFEDGNISTISLISKMHLAPAVKTALGPAFNEEGRMPYLKKSTASPSKSKPKALKLPPTSTTVKPRSRVDPKDDQNFDLLYASNFLLAYQLQEEQETLEKNIKESLALLSALNLENMHLAERETALVNEIERKKHKLELHDLLSKQNKELQAALSKMPEVRENLGAITASLEQCQSEIPVQNIKLPENQDDLVPSFETLNSALADILHSNQALNEKIGNISTAMPEIRSTLESTRSAISRSESLSSKLDQLSSKEASVLIQRIQEITSSSMTFEDPKWKEPFKFV